jgi:hypothetical protein
MDGFRKKKFNSISNVLIKKRVQQRKDGSIQTYIAGNQSKIQKPNRYNNIHATSKIDLHWGEVMSRHNRFNFKSGLTYKKFIQRNKIPG